MGEPPCENKARRHERGKCHEERHAVQDRVPTQGLRQPRWRSGWEAHGWIRRTQSSREGSRPKDPNERWTPGPRTAATQCLPHSDCKQNGEQTADQKVCNLNPPQVAEAEHADRMPSQIETLACKRLNQRDPDEERARDHSAREPR